MRNHAAKAIINAFFNSNDLLSIVKDKAEAIKKYANPANRAAELTKSVFVSMKEFFNMDREQFTTMKGVYPMFTKKFSEFYETCKINEMLHG